MSGGIRITKGELQALVWQEPITTIAKRFKLSPNGFAKICDRLDIDRPPKGYWASRGREQLPLPILSPEEASEIVEIGGERHSDRRRRTRMSLDDRRQQIMDAARDIVVNEGVHEVSLRQIARNIGISEAQAYNCFKSRHELLVELTMREFDVFEEKRRDIVARGSDRVTKVILSTMIYLQIAAERGIATMRLMSLSDVRDEVVARRREQLFKSRRRQIAQLRDDRGVSEERARIDVSLLGHMTLRAGGLVSRGKLSIDEAQMIVLPPIVRTATSREAVAG